MRTQPVPTQSSVQSCRQQCYEHKGSLYRFYFKWMKYMGYNNFTNLCVDLCFEPNHIHDFNKLHSGWTILHPEIWHHEQTQVAHQVDVNKNEGHHI